MKTRITEEMGVQKEWYKQAREMTMDKLPDFLKHLTEDYEHDYGTIVHAMTAGAIATLWAMNKTEQGEITDFQAGLVMWGFMRQWMFCEGPLQLIPYNNMFYPQYKKEFEKIISKEFWKDLQEKVKMKLVLEGQNVHPAVRKHWESIVKGIVPFGFVVKEE